MLFPWPVDRLHLAFFLLQAALTLRTWTALEGAGGWLAFDFAAILALVVVIRATARSGARARMVARLVHGCVVVPIVFTQVGLLIRAIGGRDLAATLERVDRGLCFGINPLEAVARLANPVLTELMQWAYTAYLLLPPVTVVLLALRATPALGARSLFSLLTVFYLSYVGYYLVPASGPNIHNNFGPLTECGVRALPLYRFESDLPGLWLARELRRFIWDLQLTKLDCFPSGHVAIAVTCWIHCRRVGRRFGRLCLPVAVGVVLSTIYLRYHFVIDVLAGIGLALVATGPVEAWHRRLEGRGTLPAESRAAHSAAGPAQEVPIGRS